MRLPLLLNVQPHPDGVMLWFSITLKWLVMHTNQHEEERRYGPTGLAGSLPARQSSPVCGRCPRDKNLGNTVTNMENMPL